MAGRFPNESKFAGHWGGRCKRTVRVAKTTRVPHYRLPVDDFGIQNGNRGWAVEAGMERMASRKSQERS